ncbi:MAG: efflux RND transporter permease subunit [Pseudomonadales bacterium]|nr:efflux RND transporter permease subunit [Pseudomonadales bacterium]
MNNEPLNIAGKLARYFVESKLTILICLAILGFGGIGLLYTPREENPQIIIPAAQVQVALPGASPLEVEQVLLSSMESEMASIAGVRHVFGTATKGLATVMVEFEVGQNKEDAMVRLYTNVLRNRHRLPPGASEPSIQSIDIDDVPVFTVTLTSEKYSDHELRRIAERILERLRSVEGVGIGYVVGGLPREIRIEVLPERLQSFGISIDQLAAAVDSANIDHSMGLRVYDAKNNALRVDGLLRSAQQIADIIVFNNDGRLIRVSDLAEIVDGPPTEREQMTRFAYGAANPNAQTVGQNEMAATTIAVAKRIGVNSVEMTTALRERLAQMEEGFIPPEVNLVVTRDDGIKADSTVSELVRHLLFAIAVVSFIMLVFLGRRAAMIVAITIPLVFAVVIGSDLLAGPTLNRITLYALILSLGMLVDDAIVVIENIHRHFDMLPADADQQARSQAAVRATHEIGNPTTLATFTVITVFLALTMITGMLGQYFYPFAFNVPIAMISSLVIAYTVAPWLARRWLPTAVVHFSAQLGDTGSNEKTFRTQTIYKAMLTPLQNSQRIRFLFFLGLTLALIGSLLQPTWQFIRPGGSVGPTAALGIPVSFMPKDNKNTFLVNIHLPESAPLEITDQVAREIGQVLAKRPLVTDYQTYVGIPAVVDFNSQLRGSAQNVGPQFAEIRVNLVNKLERKTSSIDIVLSLRPEIAKIAARYPGAVIQLLEDPSGPPVRATVLAELYGPDLDVLDQLTEHITNEYRSVYDMAEVHNSLPSDITEYQFQVRRDAAALAGLDPARVSQALGRLINGETLGFAHPQGERNPVPIKLQIPRQHRIEPYLLERAFVTNPAGKKVPLSELIDLVEARQLKPIHHKDTERVHYIGGELADSGAIYAVLDLDHRLDGMQLQDGSTLKTANMRAQPVRPNTLDGYTLLWEGELRLTLDAFRDMGAALVLSLAIIYLLLVGYYRSFKMPVLVMSAIPLALIGVFPGHWLFDMTFSAASMAGIITLAGVVVRNSLLIVEFIQDNLAKGMEIDEAIRDAGAIRLRPIMLTTMAIVLGTAIMVPDPVFGGLAISIIFGSMASALFVVFVVPLLYKSLSDYTEAS